MATIKLYELPPSPNNMKVRIALNYKGIEFERIPTDFEDMERKTILDVSGQPLTPAMTHGDTVMFDSAAIVRYLEANFRDTSTLFATTREGMWEIEEWEMFAKGPLREPSSMIFNQAMAETPDLAICQQASNLLNDLTGKFEERLADNEWLAGDHMTIADITGATMLIYSMLPEEPEMGIGKFFYNNYKLGDGRDKTREWVLKVMAYDK